jgi:hypothetical protein
MSKAKSKPDNRAKQGNSGQFQKGKSGNPGGRPKVAAEVRALAGEFTELAIYTLAGQIHMSDDERVVAAACNSILDRAIGRAPQAITGDDGGPIRVDYSNLSDAQLRKLREILADAAVDSSA